MQYLEACTGKDGNCVWDIDKYPDKSILLINVREESDKHWLLSIEAFIETKFQPKIKAGRIG